MTEETVVINGACGTTPEPNEAGRIAAPKKIHIPVNRIIFRGIDRRFTFNQRRASRPFSERFFQ
jgi:hypothetical protein